MPLLEVNMEIILAKPLIFTYYETDFINRGEKKGNIKRFA